MKKFRAWDKIKNRMCDVWEISWKAWDEDSPMDGIVVADQLEPDGTYIMLDGTFILEQCTGLKDKTGEYIYEGDILDSIHVVSWVGDNAEDLGMEIGWYMQRDNFESFCRLTAGNDEYKIVGNIHQRKN